MLRSLILAPVLALALVTGAAAESTPITVRVLSQGAKFIGSSMGGVQVTLTNADTGEILASGKTRGGTGDTKHIMETPHPRGAQLSQGDAAAFRAVLDLSEPTRIKVTATGPTAQRQAAETVTATRWVLPGKGIGNGDGWLLEMPGFAVDIQEPPAHLAIKGTPQTIEIEANVTMMCGCPVAPEGVWDSASYEIAAIVYRDGQKLREVPLKYQGKVSQFSAKVTVEQPGTYEAVVYAHDPANGNTGLDKVTFVVSK